MNVVAATATCWNMWRFQKKDRTFAIKTLLLILGTTVFLPSDHVVQIHDGQCPSNQKTQPTTP